MIGLGYGYGIGLGLAAGTSAGTTPFVPTALTGLVLFAQGEDADATTVTTVTDRSGQGNHLTGVNGPTKEANSISGKTTINGDGSTSYLTTSIASLLEKTIILVFKFNAIGAFKSIIGAKATGGGGGVIDAFLAGSSGTASQSLFRAGVGNTAAPTTLTATGNSGDYANNTPVVLTLRSSGTTSCAINQWINSAARGSDSAASVPLTPTVLALLAGAYGDAFVDFADAKLACVLIYNRALTTEERLKVEDWCQREYSDVSMIGPWTQLPNVAASNGAIHTEGADIDGDGDEEFVTCSASGLLLSKWDGNSFVTVATILSGAAVAAKRDRFGTEMVWADVDGDGELELVVPDSSNAGTDGELVYYKRGVGGITDTWTEHSLDSWTGSGADSNKLTHAEIEAASLTGNGKTDLVLRDIAGRIYVFPNTNTVSGTASFGTRRFIQSNPREGLAIGAIRSNGRKQIIGNGFFLDTPTDLAAGSFTLIPINGMANWYPATNDATTVADYACKVIYVDFGGGARGIVISNAEKLLNDASTSTKPLGVRFYQVPADPENDAWTETALISTNYSWHTLRSFVVDGTTYILSALAGVGVENPTGRLTVWAWNGAGFDSAVNLQTGTKYYSAVPVLADDRIHIIAPENWNSGTITDFPMRDIAA